jgi:hypothetical protein
MNRKRTRSLSRWLVALVDTLLVVIVLTIALQVVASIVLMVDPNSWVRNYAQVTSILTVPDGVWPVEDLVRIEGGAATAETSALVRVALSPASRRFVLLIFAAGLLGSACYLILLLTLRNVCSTVTAGGPFRWENVRRIRVMGWTLIGMAALDLLIDAVALAYLTTSLTVAGEPARVPGDLLLYEFPFGKIFAGLAVLVLGEIFKTGADLEDDQALTI